MTILDKIVADKKRQLARFEEQYAPLEVKKRTAGVFIDAIKKAENVAIIAEIKKASPSKGVLVESFQPIEIATAYEQYGATCISVLTDEAFFQGGFPVLQSVHNTVTTPLLCKDFIIDPIQIKMAAAHGASCILLIAAILETEELVRLKEEADKYGLDTLVEIHNEAEWEKIKEANFPLIGINNRNLHTFDVSLSTTVALAAKVKKTGALVIAESGLFTSEDAALVAKAGVDGLLIGEALMKAPSIEGAIASFQVRKERIG